MKVFLTATMLCPSLCIKEKDMADPVVSVVIPAYRSGPLLREAVDSIMGQTFQDFEIILVDNNADEETKTIISEVCALYPEKVRTVHEPVQGNCSARNRGILEARGQYIALLDDDDKMYPERLECQVSMANNNPEATVIYGLMDVITYDGSKIIIPRLAPSVEFFVSPVMKDHPRYLTDPPLLVAPSVILFSKEKALKVGLFDTLFNPCHTEDTDFCFRMWHLGPFVGINRPLSMYRQASPTFFEKKRRGMVNWFQVRKNQNQFFKKMASQYLDEKDPHSRRKFREVQSQLLRETSHDILPYIDGKEFARKMLLRAIKAKPLEVKNWKWFLRTFYPRTILQKTIKKNLLSKNLAEDMPDLDSLKSFYKLFFDSKGAEKR